MAIGSGNKITQPPKPARGKTTEKKCFFLVILKKIFE